MLALAVPAEHPPDAVLTRDYVLVANKPINQRRRYSVTSWLDSTMSLQLTHLEERWALQVPERFNPRSQELAEQWREEERSDRAIVERALRMFREQPFVYTLQPPPLRGDTVDDFLFNTRRGFCEHYASSFTFLMRAAGIPTRVVTGYLGGEFNPVSGDFVVRQSDAHAWAEVWFEESGWTRVDPTGAVSPSRIEQGISQAFGEEENVPAHLRRNSTDWVWEVQARWEAINAAWNEFFLAYGPDAQKSMLALLGLLNGDWVDLVLMLGGAFLLFGIALAAYLSWLNRPPPVDALRRQFERLRKGLEKSIGRGPAGEGPRDFLARAQRELPAAQAARLAVFANLYLAQRYGTGTEAELRDIRRQVSTLLKAQRSAAV